MTIKQKIEQLVEESKLLSESTEETTEVLDSEKTEPELNLDEDMSALFNGETLSEEFKTKATTIFEAAVVNRVKLEVSKLEEDFASKLVEKEVELKTGLVEHVDGFLDLMVEQWIEDNEVALEVGIKAEISENVLTGLHKLMSENYITVPEEKFDLVEKTKTELTEANNKLVEALEINTKLVNEINESKRQNLVTQLSEGLTDVDVEKFNSLVSELSYDNEETFKSKLVTIKENYFTKKQTSKIITEDIGITDTPAEDDTGTTIIKEENSNSPLMSKYLQTFN